MSRPGGSGAASVEKAISSYERLTMRVTGPLYLLRLGQLSPGSFANNARPFANNFRNDIAAKPRCVCGRRLPHSGRLLPAERPPRWAFAGPLQPAMPATVVAAPHGGLADVPSTDPVDETPVASSALARGSVSPNFGLVFNIDARSVLESLSESTTCPQNWSFAERTRSAPITPMKSAPCGPNWSFASSQGS